ncbi:MAG: zinc ABC transporter substrate-binding protein [Chloroflexi bacterium]|nr:zinc ABC transporter substrate-binding protein [Chloroflexota bacterium]
MRVKRSLLVVLSVLIVAAGLSCGPLPASGDGKKTIAVTYSVLGSLVKELVGDKATVVVPMPNGADPHDWEPSARDVEIINKADLVVENGLGLEGGMANALQRARERGVKFFTAADHITVRHVRAGEGLPGGDPDQQEGAEDPHIWTDPVAMKSILVALAATVRAELKLDLADSDSVLPNKLGALNGEVVRILSVVPQEKRKLVTGHESLGYFAERYSFKLIGAIIPNLSTEAGTSASQLGELKKIIQESDVKVIFTELGTPESTAAKLASEAEVRIVQLNAALLPADGSYFTFMTDLAGTIAEALR